MPQDSRSARARAEASTEAAWQRIECEFGLLDAEAVTELLTGYGSSPHEGVEELRRTGRLLSTRRSGAQRYPAFQFDVFGGAVRPLILLLRRTAHEHGWSDNGLILWMCARCGRLEGRRPVDCLDDPAAVLEAARSTFDVSW